jgi:hypothetical protein
MAKKFGPIKSGFRHLNCDRAPSAEIAEKLLNAGDDVNKANPAYGR